MEFISNPFQLDKIGQGRGGDGGRGGRTRARGRGFRGQARRLVGLHRLCDDGLEHGLFRRLEDGLVGRVEEVDDPRPQGVDPPGEPFVYGGDVVNANRQENSQ